MEKNLYNTIEALEGEIEFLNNAISDLDIKLGPIIVPDTPVPNEAAGREPDSSHSILTYKVLTAAEHIKELRMRLNRIMNAVDLPADYSTQAVGRSLHEG